MPGIHELVFRVGPTSVGSECYIAVPVDEEAEWPVDEEAERGGDAPLFAMLTTLTSQKRAAVPRRARIQGSSTLCKT